MSLFSDLENLPDEPGVYLIKDSKEKIIYIGKAKNLKNRVKQHFQPASFPKEEKIHELAHRIDWILTRNESEALILEQKLVRQFSPKLNSMLKDDKSNLLVRITMEEKYPQLLIVRETDPRNKKSVYFGPFPSNMMLRRTIKVVLRLFPICNCGRNVERIREKGTSIRCMRERLGRCLAPHKTDINPREYRKTVRNVISFLQGKVANLIDNLEKEMWLASKGTNFEKAANLRDLITAVRTILNLREDLRSDQENIDIIGFIEEENILSFCKLEVRNHRVNTIQTFLYTESDETVLTNIGEVLTYIYGQEQPSFDLMVQEGFVKRFEDNIGINLKYPRSDISTEIVKIAERNARNELVKFLRDQEYSDTFENVLEEMKKTLRLAKKPSIIHGYDISTLSGQNSVGSCVVFADGKPNKSLYRRFKIKKQYTEPNDYAMMEEVISRRYQSSSLKSDPLPNLIVVDGGKGQLNIAQKVLKDLKLSFPVISLAKRKEEIFVQWSDESIELEEDSSVLRLLQYIRDEAHRFAVSYHRILRLKTSKETIFEKIKGIGRSKAQILLQEYKGLEDIASKPVEEIMKKLAVNEDIAKKVIETAKNLKSNSFD